MFAAPIRWVINSKLSPIIEQSLWRKKLRSEDEIASATGCTVGEIQAIRRNPASIPARDLHRFIRCLDEKAYYDMEIAWLEISMFGNAYRKYLGWALRAERAAIKLLRSPFFWSVIAARIIIDLFISLSDLLRR